MSDFIDFKQVEDLWSKNTRPSVFYIHNPFCKKNNCSYCFHACYPTVDDELVEKFYFEYYPKLFKLYENIIEKQKFVLLSFGGGTPNWLSAEKFDKFLSMFPKKLLQLRKIIEIHPSYLTRDFLDVLKKYNFTTVIFCFQTFDKKTLDDNNRKYRELNEIQELWNYAKSLGFSLSVDLITYWTKTENDYTILDNDLKILQKMEPDEISVSPLYQNKYSAGTNIYPVYQRLSAIILKYFPDYLNPDLTLSGNFEVNTIRIYKPSSSTIDHQICISSLTDFPWETEQGYSTVGIGEYKSKYKPAYSIIGPNYTIYERFNGFDNLPKFELVKKYNFWEAAHNVLNALEEKLREVPVGANIVLQNVAKIYDETNFFAKPSIGNCEFLVSPRQCFSKISDAEQNVNYEFCDKLKKIDKNEIYKYNC